MNIKNFAIKKRSALLVIVSMLMLLSGCSFSNRPEKYQSYVESLITANYLGISDEYLETTGANASDAEALYLANATRLAENLVTYYGLEISNDSTLGPEMVELAKNIYSKTKFEVGEGYKKDDVYYVDVTIYPINILNQTSGDVEAYIDEFNTRVKNGYYNNYERADYEHEFAVGLISILQDSLGNITYADPVTITVKIITSDDSYYISDEDALAIDAAIIAVDSAAGAVDATPNDAAE